MPISSGDIQKKEFHIAFKGYKPEEVDKFLDMISIEFDRLAKKTNELQETVDKLKYDRTNDSDEMKQVLQDALISAHKVAEDIKQKAKLEADNIYNQRKEEAENELRDLELKKEGIEHDMAKVKEKYLSLKQYLQDALKNLEGFEKGETGELSSQDAESQDRLQEQEELAQLEEDNLQDKQGSDRVNSGPAPEDQSTPIPVEEEQLEKQTAEPVKDIEEEKNMLEEEEEEEDFNIGKKGKSLDIANPDIIDDFFKTDEK